VNRTGSAKAGIRAARRLFLSLVIMVAPLACADERRDVVLESSAGYTVTLSAAGNVRVTFAASSTEPIRERAVDTNATQAIFDLVRSDDFQALGPSYIAPSGSFESFGHEYRESLSVLERGRVVKSVQWGSSRTDVPAVLTDACDRLRKMAEATGKLPVHLIN
jgi:hypothetical protein